MNARVIHNVYNTRVNESARNRVSFNGGNGGINARATAQEEAAAHERHISPVAHQIQHDWTARNNSQQRFSANHGTPPVVVTPRPSLAVHPKDLPPIERADSPKTGNSKLDQQYQKQQETLIVRQNQDRQTLQQKQDNDRQQLAKQKAAEARTQQVDQRHQGQTQQLYQRHTQQMQQIQQRQQQVQQKQPQVQQRQQPSGGGGSRGGNGERH